MNPIIAFIKASRWQNLLLIALTMILVRYGIIYPFFEILNAGVSLELVGGLSNLNFSLLVISSLLIAAAGNLINDYFDIKIDRVNKPEQILVGRHIKRRVAMMAHIVFNSISILIAAYLSYLTGVIELVFIHVILIATLWFYSTDFKRRLVWGNIAVAFCVALIPLVVWVFEILNMIQANQDIIGDELEVKAFFMEFSFVTIGWVAGLSVFSFLMTFVREITKDIIDIKGDAAFGCKSFPITFGIPRTKIIITTFYLVILVLILFVHFQYLWDQKTRLYIFFILGPLLLSSAITTLRAKAPQDFKLPSLLNKITSLFGVLYLILVYYLLQE